MCVIPTIDGVLFYKIIINTSAASSTNSEVFTQLCRLRDKSPACVLYSIFMLWCYLK